MLAPMEYIQRFIELMNTGGVIMWVLFVLNLLLWYGLGYRYLMLRRGTKGNVRRLINKHEKRGEEQTMRGILDYAVAEALEAAEEAKRAGSNMRKYIQGALFSYHTDIDKYGILVKTIIVLAPLIGLLGTVMGMIETFDALQNASMFSQGSSISGGISKALFTTELGLVVAVPGLILGRVLDKQADRLHTEFEQITDIICTKDAT